MYGMDPSCIEQPHRHSFTIRILSFVIERFKISLTIFVDLYN
jgi:hypothetical protein